MPQELKQVNGRWVVTGAQQSTDLAPVAPPPGQRVMPTPARAVAPRPRPQGQAKPWWAKLGNDLLYEWRQSPIGAAWNQINVGMAGASDNALRMGYSVTQRLQGRKKADPSSGRFGGELDRFVDQTYRKLGAKPPSQMSQAERNVDQMRRSVALNLVLAPVSPGFGAAKAATAVGMGLRGGAAFAVNEALSTFLDDNTSGNVANLLQLPGAVNVGQDDMVDAAFKSLLPNAAASLALGASAGAAVAGFRNIRRNVRAHRAVQREVQQRAKQEAMGVLQKDEAGGYDFAPEVKQPAQPAAAPAQTLQEANAAMEQRLGAPAPAAAAPDAAPAPAIQNVTTENFGKAQPGELPQADPAIDYWTYDPELPESTALGKTLEELSDQELVTLQQGAGLPVVERVNQTVEARAGVEPRPPVAAQMVMAPADRLADDYLESVTRKLGAREDYELRPLFDPEANPQLWQKAQALTGMDDPSQLSKADMLDTFDAMRADGQAPIVNRMMGGQMLPTAEVQAAPQVFQYKGGVNEAGEQIGNSLEGVERWDPNAENIIQVWRDANGEIGQPGAVYVVNGHNRLAAAKRMGIPSMRVEYLDSPTAGEARLQGAISNVSDGKGTVFDAAKLAREYGITDQAQLKALGKPGASGFWKEGIALGRLPEDVFTAAVNEQIPLRRAVIIGDSGVDEETMRSAYRYLVQQGPDNVKEGTLREMLAMAGQSPSTSSASQPDLLTGTEWGQSFNEGLLAKADLASSVRLMLSKEKKLFGTVGRQSGQIERVGQVDAGAAKEISGEAGRALNIFDELKYQTGPVGDLLNEGTSRVLAGEQPAAVAKQIKNRLAAAIGEAMGKEVAPAADVVQEDMFAAAARAADEPQAPIELTPDERAMAEAQLLQEAIANGEVRPPNAPIPELPEPAQVRLDDLALDEPLMPGGKLSQATADEVRLAIEHKQADAAMAWEQQQAARDAVAYEDLTFKQKKDAGLTQSIDDIYLDEMRVLREEIASGAYPPEIIQQKSAKLAGLEQRFGKAVTPEVMPAERPPKLSERLGELMRAMAESDARLFREIDGLTKTTRRAINELSNQAASIKLTPNQRAEIENFNSTLMAEMGIDLDAPLTKDQLLALEKAIRFDFAAPEAGGVETVNGSTRRSMIGVADRMRKAANALDAGQPALAPAPIRPEPLRLTAGAEQPEFTLSQELSKSAPRFGRVTIKFESDLDRAAYVLANDAVKPSKAAPKFRDAIEAAGMDMGEVVAHGKRVKAAIKKAAQGNLTGQVELPAQPFGDVAKPPTKAGADRVRQQIEVNNQTMDDIRRKAQQEGC